MAFTLGDYATLADVRALLSVESSETGDDTLLETLITRVSRWIDHETGWWFYPKTQTRKFHAIDNVDRRALLLDAPLLTITSITNGDGETVAASSYVLEPANSSPYAAIILKASSGVTWTYQTDPEQAISVAGTWGWTASTPPQSAYVDIRHACAMMAVWQYQKRENPNADTLALPELGVIQIPGQIPPDVASILRHYKRKRFGVI